MSQKSSNMVKMLLCSSKVFQENNNIDIFDNSANQKNLQNSSTHDALRVNTSIIC